MVLCSFNGNANTRPLLAQPGAHDDILVLFPPSYPKYSFTVENTDQTELPSGEQEPDLMQYVHERAWEQPDGNPRRMAMSDFGKRLARGDEIEILDVRAVGKGRVKGKEEDNSKKGMGSPSNDGPSDAQEEIPETDAVGKGGAVEKKEPPR